MTEQAVVMSCYGVSRWFDYVFIKRYLLSECENVRRVGDRGIVHVIPGLTPVPGPGAAVTIPPSPITYFSQYTHLTLSDSHILISSSVKNF